MTPPRATFRLQLHGRFTFQDAAALVPYFATLGVSDLYLSPILTARPGSMHGYDIVDPTRVSSDLGGEKALRELVAALRRHQMGVIVDIVPNHMAIGADNAWWMDVLTQGQASRFAKYFDIDWAAGDARLRGKVALPILGRPLAEALAAGELFLQKDENERVTVRYFDHTLPLSPSTVAELNRAPLSDFDPAAEAGRDNLNTLLDRQHYRLMWWRSANDEINWRRFFDINELVALRVEDDEVFDAVHATIFQLYAAGLIDGVRVDHVDGLSRPAAYCRKLRARLHTLERYRPAESPPGPAYVVVEKILSRNETLPDDWETDSTTGYDFMNEISALQHDPDGQSTLDALWQCTSGRPADFAVEEEIARRQILQRSFTAQRDGVAESLHKIALADGHTQDISRAAIERCLTEILAHFPAYRSYTTVGHASPADNAFLRHAIHDAKSTCLLSDRWLLDILGGWLSGARMGAADVLQTIALVRFQQLSTSLCAKAVEDTAFYRYGRLLSRNDVGFDPGVFSCSVPEFHRRMQARAASLPHAMLATATHDHKRGEDVRARLAVLSEMPEEWSTAVQRWLRLATQFRRTIDGTLVPTDADLATSFQTIVGAWPLDLTTSDKDRLDAYAARIKAWEQKALREAKLHSDWSAPNTVYEAATMDLIDSLFSASPLLPEIAGFAQRIAPAGAANGLAQAVLKLTVPGVPDIYQGTEYWDLSLVDPDNRGPVDFITRQETLAAARNPAELASHWRDGRIKQSTIACILTLRRTLPLLFSLGTYLPLETVGPCAHHIIAFARTSGDFFLIVAVRRLAAHLLGGDDELAVPPERWHDTAIIVPTSLVHRRCVSVLHCNKKLTLGADVGAAHVLDELPVAVLVADREAAD
jgi:(1->4)-alpha-D-glucan 1-alpha-D-glucosylmutase